jgi:hypothetical protein
MSLFCIETGQESIISRNWSMLKLKPSILPRKSKNNPSKQSNNNKIQHGKKRRKVTTNKNLED